MRMAEGIVRLECTVEYSNRLPRIGVRTGLQPLLAVWKPRESPTDTATHSLVSYSALPCGRLERHGRRSPQDQAVLY